MNKSLDGIRILDLSRVLAGPFCTQMLGDLGAEVIKVERPGFGDDTRKWGPPFLKDPSGEPTTESAYYLSCNRNKKSIAIDITSDDGQKIIHQLIEKSDVLIENFKVGGLEKYGLEYEQLQEKYPRLVCCSISGFGQWGPLAREPGYDFLAQGMVGLMAATGAPEEEPMKAGVALSDIMTGLNAGVGILAALRHRDKTGVGQRVDVAVTDCTLAAMTNVAQYYLTSGELAPRLGNAHSTIVPYQAFEASDGYLIIAIGNDGQFARFAEFVGEDWANNERFSKNAARVKNREVLIPMIKDIVKEKDVAEWLKALHAIDVPCGSVNTMDQVFEVEQIQSRGMKITMQHESSGQDIDLVGNPIKLSETPASYDRAPPVCGQDTDVILKELLDLDDETIEQMKESNSIG